MKYLYVNISCDRLIELWLRGIFPSNEIIEYTYKEHSGLRNKVKEIPDDPIGEMNLHLQKLPPMKKLIEERQTKKQ